MNKVDNSFVCQKLGIKHNRVFGGVYVLAALVSMGMLACNESTPICDIMVNCFTDDPNATAVCINSECKSQCNAGFVDVGGVCTAASCEPGSVICNDTNDGLKVCKADGTGYEAGSACTTEDANASGSTCSAGKCEVVCKDQFTHVNGVCKSVTCTPGDKSCAGDKVLVCNERGTGYEVFEACTTDKADATAVCADNACTYTCNAGFVDVGGGCTAGSCEPGSVICNDTNDGLKVCKADGTGYEAGSACTTDDVNASGSTCNAGKCEVVCKDQFTNVNGVCKSVTCTPGDKSCAGDKVLVCNERGTGYEVFEACTTDKADATAVCADNACTYTCNAGFVDVGGVCTAVSCEPGSVICNDTNDGLKVCKADGTGYEAGSACTTDKANAVSSCLNDACQVRCAENYIDVNGVCTEVICTPGSTICHETDELVLLTCNALGIGYEYHQTCTTDVLNASAVCEAGACGFKCHDGFIDIEGVCRPYLTFVDPIVEAYAKTTWDTDGNGYITDNEADAVTELKGHAFSTSGVQTLEDLNQFKNLVKINSYAIRDEQNLTSLTLLNVTTLDMYSIDMHVMAECDNIEVLQLPRLNNPLDGYVFAFLTQLHSVVLTAPGQISLPETYTFRLFDSSSIIRNHEVTLYLNKDKLTVEPKITAPNQWANQTWKAIYICDDYALIDDPSCQLVE